MPAMKPKMKMNQYPKSSEIDSDIISYRPKPYYHLSDQIVLHCKSTVIYEYINILAPFVGLFDTN